MRRLFPLLAFLLAGPALLAQGRTIPLPDTLGANFPLSDSASQTGTPEDYDAFLGVWHFTFQQRRADGSFSPPFNGHWSFRKRPGTRPVIEDQWRADNPNVAFEAGTLTYRSFNPARKQWEVQGTGTLNNAPWQPGIGWADATSRYLIQHHEPGTVLRFRYLAIEANRFLWRADFSRDNGTTWVRDWWTMEVRRVGR